MRASLSNQLPDPYRIGQTHYVPVIAYGGRGTPLGYPGTARHRTPPLPAQASSSTPQCDTQDQADPSSCVGFDEQVADWPIESDRHIDRHSSPRPTMRAAKAAANLRQRAKGSGIETRSANANANSDADVAIVVIVVGAPDIHVHGVTRFGRRAGGVVDTGHGALR
jgi:hypothetical protein